MDRNRDLPPGSSGIDLDSWKGNPPAIVGKLCTNAAETELSDGSLTRLISRLDALGYRVRISIEPKREQRKLTVEEAEIWLEEFLSNGPVPAEILFESAKLEGFSKPMVYQAGGRIGAQKRPVFKDGVRCWIWEIRK